MLDCFLTILVEVPDTLIVRKRGLDTARRVSARAADVRVAVRAGGPAGRRSLAAFDAELRDPGHTLNPGTTADLVTAALFVFLTEGGMLDRVSQEAAGLSRRTGGGQGLRLERRGGSTRVRGRRAGRSGARRRISSSGLRRGPAFDLAEAHWRACICDTLPPTVRYRALRQDTGGEALRRDTGGEAVRAHA